MESAQTTIKESDRLAGKYLTFRLHEGEYGIEVLKIREIIGIMPVTRVPRMPEFVKGVVNLRGKVIPVIDLRLKFGLPVEDYTKHTCIIVVEIHAEHDAYLVGVIVDTVNEVVDFPPADLEPSPTYSGGLKTSFIRAMGKSGGCVKILLDIDKVLSQAEIVKLQDVK